MNNEAIIKESRSVSRNLRIFLLTKSNFIIDNNDKNILWNKKNLI